MVNPPQPRQQPPTSPRVSQSQASIKHQSPNISHSQLHGHSHPHTHPSIHHTSTTSSTSSTQSSSSANHHSHGHSHSIGSGSGSGIGNGAHQQQQQQQHGSNRPSRKPSIVELLSSPPPLPSPDHDDPIHHLSLSRNPSISSRTSTGSYNPFNSTHQSSISGAGTGTGTVTGSNSIYGSNTGIDWSDLLLTEVNEPSKLIHIHKSHSVQAAFETLMKNGLTSVPVSVSKDDPNDLRNCLTFDYSDLNTYLLLIMNKIDYNELNVDEIGDEKTSLKEKHDIVVEAINKAKKGEEVPVEFIIKLHPKNPFIKFSEADTLFSVMETLGNGVHRVAITDEEGLKITGILSQRRLLKYMWENARRFPSLEFYLQSTLQDLKIGSNNPITIYDDQPVLDALHKMFNENVSSLAVIDRSKNLIGNISIVDVRNLTSSKNSHLLYKSVLNFISYNLSQKGIEEGQDQFPIFHVNNQSSLGRVIAKLVATQSHRLWVVDSSRKASSVSSQSASAPNSGINSGSVVFGTPQPVDAPITNKATSVEAALMSNPPISHHGSTSGVSGASGTSGTSGASLAASAVQQEAGYTGGTGKLIGVVTLTDILGVFANSKGRRTDPQSARNQRRRSSTSTTRSSIDSSLSIDNTVAGATGSGSGSGSGNNNNNNTNISGNSSNSHSGSSANLTGPRVSNTDASSEIFRKQFVKSQENAFAKE
ncbi:cell separation during budding [Lodderomyces elongisporus]|uniref:cell separation during budding n=1 Tax=Lodderomyces elongisporus TaxID=36914 RepID=UPI002920DA30|nr:cell separation during budding [Lodderomyces elongisporus]WLF76869.1 cell separation during budding [Lodderomyces elongisporus]